MLFNSFQFAWFLALVYGLFRISSPNWRNLILLLASGYFYAAFIPKYLLVLLAVIVLDYLAGILIESFKQKKLLLIVSLVGNVGILAIFKYYNFFADNMNSLAAFVGWRYSMEALSWALPIGLSFHTFQSMSYTIEVYRGNQKAERNFLTYALYVLYFPQLVAGPIERPQNMLSQFHRLWKFNYAQARDGLQLMASGFLKKCVVADTLAILVNQAYGSSGSMSGWSLVFACYFFSWQIFCDFSGYTDIARGCSKLFGIELMLNFDKPYLSSSISEFWRKWHISLSTWFRDYLYIPLGGNQVSPPRRSFNLFLVFFLSGLWHGANWTFIIWGIIHWLLLSLGFLISAKRIPVFLKTIFVFHAVTFAWIFFRAENLAQAKLVISRILSFAPGDNLFASPHFFFGILCVVVLAAFQYFDRKLPLWEAINKKSLSMRWAVYAGVVTLFFLCGQFSSNHFIYFQF